VITSSAHVNINTKGTGQGDKESSSNTMEEPTMLSSIWSVWRDIGWKEHPTVELLIDGQRCAYDAEISHTSSLYPRIQGNTAIRENGM
jgi:hypothetical protein